MKTAKPRPSGKISRRLLGKENGSQKPVDLGRIRREITELVSGRAVEMVETTIGEAESGHYAAMKYLFEMVGLYPATAQVEPSSPDSLAETLLRRLGLAEDSGMETKVTKDNPRESEAMGADAVK